MTTLKRTVPWFVAAILLLVVHSMHLAADRTRAAMPKLQRLALLPDGATLRTMALGFGNAIADLLWLESIQAIGERQVSDEAGRWIYRAIDIVTTLDPRFVAAYEAGGIALCTVVVMPEESNRILEKGMRSNPEEWRLPFMLGINYYFELGDDAKAAEYIAKAASIGGGPEYLASFASRLYMTAKEPQKAVEFLATSYEHSSDRQLKEFLGFRLKEALVERDIQTLERAIERYRHQFGKPPRKLEELVIAGYLTALPVEPLGGTYVYDNSAQIVHSTSAERRFQVSGHRRQR